MVLRHPRPKLVLSLTPLIDVVFILLIFFMLASQFADWRTLELTPQVQLSSSVSPEKPVSLELRNDGSFVLNGQTVDGLRSAVSLITSAGSDRTLFLKPDTRVEIQQVIDVVEVLNGAGISRVQLSRREEG